MRLTLVLGDVHQVGIGDPCLLQYRTGNRDVVIPGERADDTGRRVSKWRDPAREFGKRLGFDLLDQAADDVVEQGDVLRVEAGSAVEKKGGNSAQRLRALFRRTTSSSSGSSEAGTPIWNLQNAVKNHPAGGFPQI
jgi:hypothetical protein